MLQSKILEIDAGVSYGGTSLTLLQNDSVPRLDLLVREAIQNSSDASLEQPGEFYNVNFQTGDFSPASLNQHFSGLGDVLNARFVAAEEPFLEIRDTKTIGLNGPIRKKDLDKKDHGNFFKLIFDTGKKQAQNNAGGNWGFGKSVYYRLGIGLVIFYSQTLVNGSYESRLIATVMEDETKTDRSGNDITLLNGLNPLSAGKAWWGVRDGSDILPVQDKEEIKRILDVFKLAPFGENETGTSIIIPYISPKQLLDELIPADREDVDESALQHYESQWASSIENYLKLAIQKWYAPKVHNRELKNCGNLKWLRASIRHVGLKKSDMLNFFNLVQELYTTALAPTFGTTYTSAQYPQIQCKEIRINNYFTSPRCGYLAMIKISRAALKSMTGQLDPYCYLGHFGDDAKSNTPIIMYAREPGMVIDYSTTGPWVKSINQPENPDEFVFAFFVPTFSMRIKSNFNIPEYANKDLGSYLRSCEASDHMGWNDPTKMQIVARIQKRVVNTINTFLQDDSKPKSPTTGIPKLSNRLGAQLIPERTMKGPRGNGPGGSGKAKGMAFNVVSQALTGNSLDVQFSLKLFNLKKSAAISLTIFSESGWIDPKSWYEDIDNPYPASIDTIAITSIQGDGYPEIKVTDAVCNSQNQALSREHIELALSQWDHRDSFVTATIKTDIPVAIITGTLKIMASDKTYKYSLKVD